MTRKQHEIEAIRSSREFDETWYVERYRDVAMLGMDPVRHYVMLGALMGRNPSPQFHTDFYLNDNPDVAAGGLNPLFHYISSGRDEGRKPRPEVRFPPSASLPETTARLAQFRFDKNCTVEANQDWVVFVAYSSDGLLSDLQRYQISAFRTAGYAVALVLNTDRFFNFTDPNAGEVDIQIIRENIGFDFGAWRHAVELIGGLGRAHSVTFTNDSILPAGAGGTMVAMREAAATASADVIFLTENLEIKPHLQSYLFTMTRRALDRNALALIAEVPVYIDKDALIQNVEIHFAEGIREVGFSTKHLFETTGIEDNPTIHHWERLLDDGFPFVKIQLIGAEILSIDDLRLKSRLGGALVEILRDHCQRRGVSVPDVVRVRNTPPKPALPIAGMFNEYGAQQAWNLPGEQNLTVKVPLQGLKAPMVRLPSIVAIIHGYYTDVSAQILHEIAALELPIRLVVTTDTVEKVATIDAQIAARGLDGRAVLCPNRGRDLGPFVVEGATHLGDAEIILHLHTKKSPHDSIYAGWGDFLRGNLLGSREIVLSIIEIFAQTDVGLVYSDHFPAVANLRNWGFDFVHTQQLMKRVGCDVSADMRLEFPTSSMFWARRSALDPLFEMGLTYSDFEEEAGQIDGTLAHGIERALLYLVEYAGYSYAKVTALDTPTEPFSPLLNLTADGVKYAFQRPMPRLIGDTAVRSEFYDAVPEIYPVTFSRARKTRCRLNALLPTMKPEKIFGGITTALAVIRKIAASLPANVDLRVLITSDTIDRESVIELSRRLDRDFSWTMPDDDVDGNSIVGVAENQHIPLSIRPDDMFVATAWWTADLGFRMIDSQRELFGHASKLAYIIQDYEPGFYAWSNTYALAEATYHRSAETIAIINSEELTDYLLARYEFAETYHIPYQLHPRLEQLLAPTRPEKLILVYGRPGVSRNCFNLIHEGLRIWQARNPVRNCSYEVAFAGEPIDLRQLGGLANATCVGKLSIEDYALILNRAAVGISLMVSPHPSYPPLEMASAGCVTITNGYENKDLRKRSDNFISLEYLSAVKIADALDEAVCRVNFERPAEIYTIKNVSCRVGAVDYRNVADGLLGALNCIAK